MNWKKLLLGLLLLIILVPTLLYVGSLDWAKKHSVEVAKSPLFSKDFDTGKCRIKANGLEFFARVAGMKNTGKNVILLHGFPESSIEWEALIKAAADSNYRVLAFDQRGYSPNARPSEVSDYQLNKLSEDVFAVADAVGFDTFHLVGHDWGAGIGWKAVMDKPERIITWTALSVPHLGAFFDGVLNDTIQAKRSGYFKFFQKKYLPEFLLTFAGQKGMKKVVNNLPENQKLENLSIMAEPFALTAELNWYRAMDVEGFVKNKVFEKEISRPTLFIWGKKDLVISETVIKQQKKFIKGKYKEIPLDAGHNLIQEKEKIVIGAILEHFKE
jgi:pimeloyl-ACP methyl ester carboxylesterase